MKYLTIKELQEKMGGVSRWYIYTLMNNHGFPKPIKYSYKVIRWKEEEVNEWIEKKAEERNEQ